MQKDIEIDLDIEPIEFDRELPVDLAKITDRGVERARILPNGFIDRHPDYPETLMPKTFLSENSLLVVPRNLPGYQRLNSNRRLKLGKIVLLIPGGFLSRLIDNACQQQFGIKPTGRLPYRIPNDIHLNLVAGGIIELDCDQFRTSKVNFGLRNKSIENKDIKNCLDYFVYCGALQEIENTGTQMPVVGRKPTQEYLVLWGQSQFFPEKPQRQIAE